MIHPRAGDSKLDFRSSGEGERATPVPTPSAGENALNKFSESGGGGGDDKTIYSFPDVSLASKNEKTAIGTLHNFSGGGAAITPERGRRCERIKCILIKK